MAGSNRQSKTGNAMSCDNIQQSLSLYVDDGLTADERLTVYQHLEVCPVCRARVGELRNLRSSLATLSTPLPPADLIPAINTALAARVAELRARRNATAAQVVFRFAQAVGMLPLTGTTDPAHMAEDLASDGVVLSAEDVHAIESIAG